MPSDEVHIKWAWGASVVGALVMHTMGMDLLDIIYIVIIFMFGTEYVSPDLDINSRPFQRWSILRVLWRPYTDYVPHRGTMSHNPIVGPIALCIWFTLIVGAVVAFLTMVWLPVIEPLIDGAQTMIGQIVSLKPTKDTVKMLVVFYSMIIASQVYHIALDKMMKGDRQA